MRAVVAPRQSTGTAAHAAASDRLVAGVDLGTTTVAAAIVDTVSGLEVGRAVTANRQAAFGSDVLSRLSLSPTSADDLARAALNSTIEALAGAAAGAQVQLEHVRRVVIAGNTAMLALLVGVDTTSLAQAPFAAPSLSASWSVPTELSDMLATDATVTLVPPIASFVGGDALAAAFAGGLVGVSRPTLLVDLGTNAEVILGLGDRIVVTSAAAGPAFEAVGIRAGGPAVPGAVVRVGYTEEQGVELSVMGGGDPLWLSGSGLISAVAMLRRLGHLDSGGLMVPTGPLEARFATDEEGVLGVALDESGALKIDQRDIRAVQLAKAAVAVAVAGVLGSAELTADDVAGVLVAGAFGESLDPGDLVELGVLPEQFEGKTTTIGNAALAGAVAGALDATVPDAWAAEVARATHVDLAGSPGFNDALIAALQLDRWGA